MIFSLLHPLTHPEAYQASIDRTGTIHMRLVDQLYDILTNEEFTHSQRTEQALIALAEEQPGANVEDKQPLSLAIDKALGTSLVHKQSPGSVRFGLASLCDNG